MAQLYPKISIITPSYNQAKFLDEAVKSVIDQNYPNFEHIVVDNCSTDGTIDILKRYPHLIWTSEPDKGQTDALNKGFKKTTGDFIGWLNADDRYLSGCFYSIVKVLKEHPNFDVVYGDFRWVDQKGHLIKLRHEIDFDLFILKYLHVTYIPSTATFFRRGIIKEESLLNPEYEYGQDYELFLRIALKGHRFIHVRSFLADFRMHPDNKTALYRDRQIADNDKILLLYDKVMRRMYQPIRPAIRALFMLLARAKRASLKTIDWLRR